jgi:AcrR family transcriptional regulator
VLAVAGRLFYEQGVRATGVAEVIGAAGCGKQALYRLFPAKDDLVAAYLEELSAARERSADGAVSAAGDDPARQLVSLTAELAEWVGRPGFRGCAMRNYLREHPSGASKARRVAEAFVRRSSERIDRLAAATGVADGADLARKVWLVHEGLYGGHRATPETLTAAVDLVSSLVGA